MERRGHIKVEGRVGLRRQGRVGKRSQWTRTYRLGFNRNLVGTMADKEKPKYSKTRAGEEITAINSNGGE